MTAFGNSPGFVPGGADPAWQTFEGDVRIRAAAGLVQLQISVDNGDGTFDISTVVLTGSLRDTRKGSVTRWPSYDGQGLPINFVTDADRVAAAQLKAQSKATIRTDSPVPVSGGRS